MKISPFNKYSSYRWLLFMVLAAAYMFVYFHRLCSAVVAVDMMRDLHADATLIGLLSSAYFYPYALMQLPSGLLADSVGPRRTITFFFIFAFAGSVILGFAQTAAVAIAGRTLVGIGAAMLFVPAMKVLSSWFRKEEYAFMGGLLIAMGGAGSLAATAPLAWMNSLIGWRLSFISVGILTLALTWLLWITVRDRPETMGWKIGGLPASADEKKIALKDALSLVLKHPPFWPLAVWFFFTGSIFFSFAGLWGGPYLIHVYGYGNAGAGNILSMFAVGMILGSPLLSFFSDNVVKKRKPVLVFSTGVSLAIIAALAFRTGALPVPLLYLLYFGMGFFTNAVVVIGFTAAKELFPVQIAGTATGIVNFFPFMGGAVFQPVCGYILELNGKTGDSYTAAGYSHAFMALCACAVISFVLSFFIKETI